MKTRITFWQNSLSIHQAPIIRALADNEDVAVRVVAEQGISESRQKLGWSMPNYGNAELIVQPGPELLERIIRISKHDTAHVFSGIGIYPMIEKARLALLESRGGKMIANTESIDTRGIPRKIRYIFRQRNYRDLISEYDLVLACGIQSYEQWNKFDKQGTKIRKFGYFVERSVALPSSINELDAKFKIVFVGSLQPWKDPMTLLKALRRLPNEGWTAEFIGNGPLLSKLQRYANRNGMFKQVTFAGSISNELSRRTIAQSDLLVLPSRYDGWGAVVNEALIDGVPAIVSHNAGVRTLIKGPLQGDTFQARNIEELAGLLAKRMTESRSLQLKNNLMKWSETCISPTAAADYLYKIITEDSDTLTPPPWS